MNNFAFFKLKRTVITKESEKPELEIRSPTTKDAPKIWQLVRETGILDPNSAYLYLLLCRDFRDTCLVAVKEARIVGFVSGYRLPSDIRVLFVWQVGVASDAKRQGIGSQLLRELVERNAGTLTAIEATVSPSNVASRRLFESLAQSLGASVFDVPDGGFGEGDFPPGDHEPEPRIRISPLDDGFSFSDAAHRASHPTSAAAHTT